MGDVSAATTTHSVVFLFNMQMDNNYSVYQHVTPDGMYYFGQTNNIKRRWSSNGAGYKKTALQPYIEQYGWDNIQHIVLFRDQTKENALFIENFLIETAREDGVCINKNRSGNVSKEEGYQREYQEQNKDKINEQKRNYYERNKDKIREYQEQNKDKIREYQEQNKDKIREYQEQNKDKINEQKRNYYERNKEKFKEYREQNKDKIREYQREYQREYKEQNKDKIRDYNREYQRQYRKRKKLEKQLKEVEI